jgi:antitoxin CptB
MSGDSENASNKNTSRDGGANIRSAHLACPLKEHIMNDNPQMRRIQFRAWHRGTREADYTVGGFFDRYHATWNEEETAWFERLMEEQDADIMGWAMGTIPVPDEWQGPMMDRFLKLDFVKVV